MKRAVLVIAWAVFVAFGVCCSAAHGRSVEVSAFGVEAKLGSDTEGVSSATRTTTGTQRVDVYRHYDARPCMSGSASASAAPVHS